MVPSDLESILELSFLGRAGIFKRNFEVNWLIEREFANTAEDIIWRRSKLGLRMTSKEIDALDSWMVNSAANLPEQHAV